MLESRVNMFFYRNCYVTKTQDTVVWVAVFIWSLVYLFLSDGDLSTAWNHEKITTLGPAIGIPTQAWRCIINLINCCTLITNTLSCTVHNLKSIFLIQVLHAGFAKKFPLLLNKGVTHLTALWQTVLIWILWFIVLLSHHFLNCAQSRRYHHMLIFPLLWFVPHFVDTFKQNNLSILIVFSTYLWIQRKGFISFSFLEM